MSMDLLTPIREEILTSTVPVLPEIAAARVDSFITALSRSDESALLLDFDGTLAPFRIDPTQVRPWVWAPELLERIQSSKRSRVAVISGRSATDVARQLRMANPPEIWGLHGAERLRVGHSLETTAISECQTRALQELRELLVRSRIFINYGLRLEDKPNAVVVHWRGTDIRSAEVARETLSKLLKPYEEVDGMELMHFDGGVELRCGPNKGDALRSVLQELSPNSPVAYLGDDLTDEFAFRALGERGLSILVRKVWRPTAAVLWLRPPGELKNFLTQWLRSVQRVKESLLHQNG